MREGRCEDELGTLGGSALTMLQGVANLVQEARLPLDEALRMASCYPARALGIDDRLGTIAPGMVANLVAFDSKWQITAILQNGEFTPTLRS